MPGKFGKAEQSIQHLVAEIAGRSISDGNAIFFVFFPALL